MYKADVVENANDTFNIETMLNDNWDKIDEKLEKLPIQNGGLYINDETTEEDKAEAVEAIKGIGLSADDIGALDVSMSNVDLNTLLESGKHFEVVEAYGAGFHSPYDEGVSSVQTYKVLSFASSVHNGFQLAFPSGSSVAKMFMRTRASDVTKEWTTGFLPLDGSVTMSGAELWLNDKAGRILSNTDLFRVDVFNTENDLSNRRAIWLGSSATSNGAPSVASAVRLFDVVNGTQKTYNIFGEHNKPSGSYTGNSSSATRTINIGGIGNILFITSPYGFGFVTADGGFFIQATYDTTSYVVSYSSSYIKFVDGVLTIASSSSYINNSSYEYTYRVL